MGQAGKSPIRILQDTGATQTLILDSVLLFSSKSSNGNSILLRGIELGTVRVPLHQVELSSEIASGSVVVGVRPSLPVQGIDLILGNDIAGGKVEANPCVCDVPDSSRSDVNEDIPGLFPACAITRAMANKLSLQVRPEGGGQIVEASGKPEEALPGGVPTASNTATCNEPGKQSSELEAIENSEMSPEELVKKQKDDLELQRFWEQAISEEEASKVPNCYYLKSDMLMREWKPRDISSSHEWKMIHQVVVPPHIALRH